MQSLPSGALCPRCAEVTTRPNRVFTSPLEDRVECEQFPNHQFQWNGEYMAGQQSPDGAAFEDHSNIKKALEEFRKGTPAEKSETYAATGAIRSKLYAGGEGREFPTRLDLLFKNREGLEALAEAFGRGNHKYGRDNWMKGFPESVFVQHMLDHLIHYVSGTSDPGEEHIDQLSGVLWNAFTLCWLRKHKPELLDVTGPDLGPELDRKS